MANGNRGQPSTQPVDGIGCVAIVTSVLFVVVFYVIAFFATARALRWVWGE